MFPPPAKGYTKPAIKRNATGFTLIELLVAIAVAVIMATWAVPGFQAFAARNEVNAEVMRIRTALALARNTAITRRTTIAVCPRPSPTSEICDFSDWTHPLVVVAGQAPSGKLKNIEVLKVLEGSGGPTVTYNRDYPIRYKATGWARGHNGRFTICGQNDNGAEVFVSSFGRVRTKREISNIC